MLTFGRLDSTCGQPNFSLSVKCGSMASASLSGVELTTCPQRIHMKRHVRGARGRFGALAVTGTTICTRQVVDPACHVLRHQSRAHRYGLTATPTHPCHSDPASVARSRAHVRPPHQGVTGLVAQGAAAWRGRVRCTDRARSEHSGSDSVHVQYLGHAPIARVVLEASARPLSVKSKCPALTFWAAAAR